MPRVLIYLLYNLLLPFLLIVGMPGYLIKGFKRGNLKRNFRQRFGKLPDTIGQLEQRPLWIHAVSVGEVLVAAKIIRALRNEAPEKSIVLTTTTTTGYAVAERELGNQAIVIHNPVDLPHVVRSVVRQINPEKLILCESEIWPNLVRHLHRLGIPVLLANARLSPRSEKRYRKAHKLIAPVFSLIDRTAVPFSTDVDRWSSVGIDAESISIMGSVKFDETISEKPHEKIEELQAWLTANGCPPHRPIFLAAATHAGEEQICARIWQNLREQHPELTLVIVPRHAERAPDFKTELEALGLQPIFRRYQSDAASTENVRVTSDQCNPYIFVSDTTGELRAWNHLATVVFVGKSLTGKGGQNLAEPVQAGKAVIVGPHMQNFAEVTRDLLAHQGIVQVEDEDSLQAAVDRFLSAPESGSAQAKRGQIAMQQHEGAAQRTAAWILE